MTIQQLTQSYRKELAPTLLQATLIPSTSLRQQLGERTRLHHETYCVLQDFVQSVTKGTLQIKKMQLAIEEDALDKILQMNFLGLPGLEALVKANLMQFECGINHTQMLIIFEKACMKLEQNEFDLAAGIFMALLFLNPFIAALWYCMARAYEKKGNLENSLYSYAICELLSKGNLYSALDAVECLISKSNSRLAKALLGEIELDLNQSKFPSQLYDRFNKLKQAINFL